MSSCLVYVTTSDIDEARSIGRAMVKARLAACANIVPSIHPIFWWDGKVQEGEESLLLLKTPERMVEALTVAVKELHSYDCPCVVAVPITGGNADFLSWIAAETTER